MATAAAINKPIKARARLELERRAQPFINLYNACGRADVDPVELARAGVLQAAADLRAGMAEAEWQQYLANLSAQ